MSNSEPRTDPLGSETIDHVSADTNPAPQRSRHESNRGLLLGLLALRNGFIDHRTLIVALREWRADAALGRTLGAILKGRGVLDSGRMALLEALVDEHLKQFGDFDKSFAALSPQGSTRELLDNPESGDLDGELTYLVAEATHEVPTELHAPSTDSAGQRSRYRVLRRLGRGNLGEVFVAQDEELNREVALKEIQARHVDSPESRSSFLMEAEITGNLEHPGIVPVHGLCEHSDGRPYYVMRLVKGETLKGAIKRFHREGGHAPSPVRRLALRELLNRFLSLCEAIGYVHSRGVIHRDLKPANVMLGPFGETLLIDFGLAKPVGLADAAVRDSEGSLHPASASGSHQSRPGTIKGTPAFMSPEQADKETVAQVGFPSDVYSLGATFYYLIVGKAPFGGTGLLDAILTKVKQGDFPKPRTLNASVPLGLEAICLKAMSLRPADRYASPKAMAEDLERWLADEPISVLRDPFLTKLRRTVRRHKPIVVGLAVLAMTGVLALAVDDFRVKRERTRAQDSFKLAREVVANILGQVTTNQLVGMAEMEPLRLEVTEKAWQYSLRFVERNPDDLDVLQDAAKTAREVANVRRMYGKFEEAERPSAESVRLFRRIVQDGPRAGGAEFTDRRMNDDKIDFALALIDRGELLRLRRRDSDAEPLIREAVALCQDLKSAKIANNRIDRALGFGLENLARLLLDQGKAGEALPLADGAVEEFSALVSRSSDPQNPLLALIAYMTRGRAARALGKLDQARDDFEVVIDQAENQHGGPQSLKPNLDMIGVEARRELASIRAADPNPARRAEAEPLLTHAIRVSNALIEKFPNFVEYRKMLINSLVARADLYVAQERKPQALDDLKSARTALESAKKSHPGELFFSQKLEEINGRLKSW